MTDAELLSVYDDAAPLPDDHLAGLRAVERAARAAEREACANLLEASLREHMAEIHRLRAALEQPSPATLFDPRGSLGEPIV